MKVYHLKDRSKFESKPAYMTQIARNIPSGKHPQTFDQWVSQLTPLSE